MIIEIILLIILIIIILLYIGIDLIGNFSKQSSKLEFSFKILLFKKIKIYSIDYPSKDKQDGEKEEDEKDYKHQITFELIEPCIGNFIEFVRSLFKNLSVRKLEGHVDLGLSSYMSTAKYVGYLWAFFVFPNTTLKNTCLTANPLFGETVIDFKGIVDVRINLLKLTVPILKLISDKNVRKLIKEAI